MRKCNHCGTEGPYCGRNAGPEFPCFDLCRSCGVGDRKPCTSSCLAEHDRRRPLAVKPLDPNEPVITKAMLDAQDQGLQLLALKEEIERLRAALDTEEWRPIETAPTKRDPGSAGGDSQYPKSERILLRIEKRYSGLPTVYRCAEGCYAIARGAWEWYPEESSGIPTHWKPMPSTDLVPKLKKDESDIAVKDLAAENLRLQADFVKIATLIVDLNTIYKGFKVGDNRGVNGISYEILQIAHEHATKILEATKDWNEVRKRMFEPLDPVSEDTPLDTAMADAVRSAIAKLNRPGMTLSQKLRYMRVNKGHGFAEDLFDAVLMRLEAEEEQTP